MPLTLAEQGLEADGNDATTDEYSSNTATSTPANVDSSVQGSVTSSTPLPPPLSDSGLGKAEGLSEEIMRLNAEHEKEKFERAEGSGGTPCTSSPPITCTSPSHCQRRVMANRARICGLLLERGARRAWRRDPTEQLTTLDKKYAALLKDDDGRTFCTFNG